MNKLKNIIKNFSRKRILVVGDVILDRYIQGKVTRISPEAPVPIVLEESFFYTPGGAANVAGNLTALGAQVVQIGKVGNDFEGKLLKRELGRKGVDVSGLFVDKSMPTITKTRIIAQHQQVVRIDKEKVSTKVDKLLQNKIKQFIGKHIGEFDGIIISDYGKGLVTPDLVETIRNLALEYKILITVDPKVEHFGYYNGVSCITPNKNEAENAIRNIKISEIKAARLNVRSDKLETLDQVDKAGLELLKFLNLESLLITLGEQGMRLFEKGRKPYAIATRAREVFDVTGAGDAVISVFTLALTAGATKRQAAELSNTAAGIVVAKMGAVAVTKEELSKALA